MEYEKVNIVKYLIASEISFNKKSSNGLNSLIFCLKHRSISTQKLTVDGDTLIFNPETLSLTWKNKHGIKDSIFIDYMEHFQIVRWIEIMAIESKIKEPLMYNDYLPNALLGNCMLFPVFDIHRKKNITIRDVFMQIDIDNVLNGSNFAEAI